jgi:transposase InsO family protein
MDISSISTPSFGGNKFWLMLQDEFTGYIWSHFLKHKSDLPPIVIQWIQQIHKTTKVQIKTIRCDNAGENKSLQQKIQADKTLNIKFEFTAPYTPEMNGKIERKFATLYGKTRSMLNGAKLPMKLRNGLWAHCARLASKLENVLCQHGNPVLQLKNSMGDYQNGLNP